MSLTSTNVKYDLLGKDISNGPKHIFGDHTDCDQYYCKGAKEGEENLVPQLTPPLFFNAIMEINRRLVCNASSLFHDMDTNAAETINSIVAKFVGLSETSVDAVTDIGEQLICSIDFGELTVITAILHLIDR
ncbi:hypothetical protein FQA39_LY16632 [Lamprigera yunnana]|nr:hypothetical protein FQA39_LY16632 [Lamprigera yunnana]